jgi:hypothetical protein
MTPELGTQRRGQIIFGANENGLPPAITTKHVVSIFIRSNDPRFVHAVY